MNLVPRLRECETAETMLELIETDYIVEENYRSLIFKLLEEIVELKQNGVPSSITAKWNELEKVLEFLKPKTELEQQETEKVLESSRRTAERMKTFISKLEEDIQRQEQLLAKQRENMNKLLEDLGIEKD